MIILSNLGFSYHKIMSKPSSKSDILDSQAKKLMYKDEE